MANKTTEELRRRGILTERAPILGRLQSRLQKAHDEIGVVAVEQYDQNVSTDTQDSIKLALDALINAWRLLDIERVAQEKRDEGIAAERAVTDKVHGILRVIERSTIDEDAFDEQVNGLAASRGTNVNNEGFAEQIRYMLLAGHGEADILKIAGLTKDDETADSCDSCGEEFDEADIDGGRCMKCGSMISAKEAG